MHDQCQGLVELEAVYQAFYVLDPACKPIVVIFVTGFIRITTANVIGNDTSVFVGQCGDQVAKVE